MEACPVPPMEACPVPPMEACPVPPMEGGQNFLLGASRRQSEWETQCILFSFRTWEVLLVVIFYLWYLS